MSKSSIHAAYKSLLTSGRLTTNPGQAALVNRLATLQNTLVESSEPQNGVYIYGSVGTGKSRIADLFAATMPFAVSKRRIHFYEFMMDIHSRLHTARSQSTYRGDPLVEIGRKVRDESRVLCFDEFQVTDIADAMILKRLFGAIWNAGGVMVATSNRHPNMLYEKGLNRLLFLPFIAELQQRCDVWKLKGEQDYRMTMASSEKERQTIFFTKQNDFLESLSSLTKNSPLKPMEIPVMMSRTLHVDGTKTANDSLTVHGTFKTLCEANLGSMDYYALCKAAKSIYISGLRKFRADELDFVRRFITLIDLAYESKTRVICLSEVPLLEVFTNIVAGVDVKKAMEDMTVRGEGGSSSSTMSTFIGETEWSATGLEKASLASGGAGETDVRFAVGRAISRLHEMGSRTYGVFE
jgi:protein AFG1